MFIFNRPIAAPLAALILVVLLIVIDNALELSTII